LLILDNFEHVIDAAPLVAGLLTHAPGLTLLTTTRTALRIRAEQRYALAPLAQPAATPLFVNRARASQYDFDLGPDNAADIAAICRRLDGLPLAIELIAAQVGPTSPAELVQQLEPLLPMLADAGRWPTRCARTASHPARRD